MSIWKRIVEWFRPTLNPEFLAEDTSDDCDECGGTGAIEALGPTRCEACNGTGKRPTKGPRS